MILFTATGPVSVDPQPDPQLTLSRLQAAVIALGIAAGSATVALRTTPAPSAAGCLMAEEVFYSQPDSLFWVPVHGSPVRDSLLRVEGGLPDTDVRFANRPVQVCFPAGPVGARPVWKD